jgi:ubiquinone/menaquinone biosynthesis C-methylase UbiE
MITNEKRGLILYRVISYAILMGWSSEKVIEFYKSYAKQYDQDISSYPALSILTTWTLDHIQATLTRKPVKIADIGCGTGKSSAPFFTFCDCEVVGVDASESMLSYAKKYPFHKLICADIEKVEIDDIFDVILCIGVFDFISNIEGMLNQFFKWTRKGEGIVALTLPTTRNDQLNAWSTEEIELLVLNIGFQIIKSERIVGYQDSETAETTWYQGYLLERL